MSLSNKKHLHFAVLFLATLSLLIPVIFIEQSVFQATGGNFTLPQDDSYINIAVGKNMAFYGVWGLSKYVSFQPAASSLLYPILLVPIFFIAGAHLIIPLLINAFAAISLLWSIQQQLIQKGTSPTRQLLILLLLSFFTPLPLLILSGMEYTLFLLFVALFIRSISRSVGPIWRRKPLQPITPLSKSVYIYAALLIAIRYEGLIIVAVLCAQLLYWRQPKPAFFLGLAGVTPILLLGVISLSKGSPLIPLALIQPLGAKIYTAALLGALLIIVIMTTPGQFKRQRLAYVLVGIIALFRTTTLLVDIPRTSADTWYQQIQAAHFVHRYYARASVSLNNTGAISYFTEGRKIDLTGIAIYPVLRSNQRRYWSPTITDSLSWWEGARLAILFEPHSQIKPVGRWGKVASWNDHDAGRSISFYALDTSFAKPLRLHLKEYEKSLPPGMHAKYY